MRNVLLIFIDGLGLGADDPAVNPLVRFDSFFTRLFNKPFSQDIGTVIADDVSLAVTDATLGIEGLPQSATGQTTIFTGVNASQAVGHHVVGFPGPTLVKIIAEHGIMRRLKDDGLRPTSANMYTPNYMELVAARKRRHSVTTHTILAAGEPLRSVAEMSAGQAVYQDITNEMLAAIGTTGVPVITPETAGQRLVAIAKQYNYTMFEYFQTDRCGHKGDWRLAEKIVFTLSRFLATVFAAAPRDMLVLVTSDHGNFEDLSVKPHTLNPVPTIIKGPDCGQYAAGIRDLTGIVPVIRAYLKEDN
jgi:hypothetical protein